VARNKALQPEGHRGGHHAKKANSFAAQTQQREVQRVFFPDGRSIFLHIRQVEDEEHMAGLKVGQLQDEEFGSVSPRSIWALRRLAHEAGA
jgi:hypothetical protein